MLINCPNTYKTQNMYNEAVDDCLEALNFIPEWFVTSQTLENFHDVLLADDDIIFLMKILIRSHFLLIKWLSLLWILIKLF